MATETKKTATKTAAKKTVTAKKTVAKKTTSAKTTAAKKTTVAKKPAAKKAAPAKKTATKATPKATTKKAAPKKTPVKKATAPKKTASKAKFVTFRIKRGEQVDGVFEARHEEFKVEYDDSTTILQGLEKIKGEQDGSLTFRRSCRASICGSCGMFVNNRSRLACKTKVKDMVNGVDGNMNVPASGAVIEIEAQKNQPVLKDLVVDIQPFYKKVNNITPVVQEGAETNADVDKTSFEQVNMVSNCIMCGACYSDCTAMTQNPDFLGPAALAKAFRFVSDPREGQKTDRLKELSEKNGIWDCTRCGMCVDACPKGVAPMEAIVKLRTRAMSSGVTNNPGARHAMAFKRDIATWGVLNEPIMLLKTLRHNVIKQAGNALNLVRKGKIPNPLPFDHKTEGLNEVRDIFKELEKNPIDVETRAEDTGPGAG